MPEERKAAPLPPEPWTANEFGPCTQNHVVVRDADGKQVALIPKSQLIAIELAELVCRAPALEAERDDANMQATANNEVATSLHEQLKHARALRRELAAASNNVLTELDNLGVDAFYSEEETHALGIATDRLRSVLRRAEAEATEESEQKMNLQQALAVLAREKHNGYAQWDGTCPEGNPAWRTEFECIAIAEAYERKREPDPCTAPTTTAGERSEG
jgi:hypothetical protein